MKYLPARLVGLIIAVIFAAAMSAISGEVNSLAAVKVIDIYKRRLYQKGNAAHDLPAAVNRTSAFYDMIAVETAIFAAYLFTGISFLWYNVIATTEELGLLHSAVNCILD